VRRVGGKLSPGSDASDARFFRIDRIPENMAFPTDLFVIDKLKRRAMQHERTKNPGAADYRP
jgi:hypothetical protein